MRIYLATALGALSLSALMACTEPAEDLPGGYVGSLSTTVQASRIANIRPDEDSYVGEVTHYANSTSTNGAHLSVRRAANVGGTPSYEARLADLCDLRFQLLEGGRISDNMLLPTCGCDLDAHWVTGDAAISGDFTEHELRVVVDVTLPRSEYSGGCTHSFVAMRP